MNDELMKKAKALVDCVSEDVNGKPGMPFSGNGGLVSDRTIRACDDLRLAMAAALIAPVQDRLFNPKSEEQEASEMKKRLEGE